MCVLVSVCVCACLLVCAYVCRYVGMYVCMFDCLLVFCENNTSYPSPRLCHFGDSRHFALAEKGASELQGYFDVSVV